MHVRPLTPRALGRARLPLVLAIDGDLPGGVAAALAAAGARVEPGARETLISVSAGDLHQALTCASEPLRGELQRLADAAMPPEVQEWRFAGGSLRFGDEAKVLGVLNVTPNSFYDGGHFARLDAARQRAWEIAEHGAAILDVGGRSYASTVPPASAQEEIERVVPIVEALARDGYPLPISIDTTSARVAEAALEAGAAIVNDCSGLADPRMPAIAARTGAGLIIMHVRGALNVRSAAPYAYRDVLAEIVAFLAQRIEAALASGGRREQIVLDPGLEFGKEPADDCEILERFGELRGLGRPLLLAASRKSFLGRLLGRSAHELLPASLAAAAVAIEAGARLVRAHDVRETVDCCRALAAFGHRSAETANEATARALTGS